MFDSGFPERLFPRCTRVCEFLTSHLRSEQYAGSAGQYWISVFLHSAKPRAERETFGPPGGACMAAISTFVPLAICPA